MALAFTAVLIVAIVVGAVWSFLTLPLLAAFAVVLIAIPLAAWLAVLIYGLRKKAQGLRPFDAVEQALDAERLGGAGRYVTTADGRIVEYLVYGSPDPDAKVIVQMHGSGSTGGLVCKLNASLCEQLNLKGIAPSMPCHGYSDLHVGRTIAGFPKDLETILDAEGVGEFMVEGTSFGTAHSMAIAWYFGPERCLAMGLNVPYLSDQICKEFDLESKADALPRPDARAWYQAWNFLVAELMYKSPLLSPPARFLASAIAEGKKVAMRMPWAFEDMGKDHARLVARGSQGQGWEQFSFDVTALWGFDPREIQTRNVAVWYAKDDTLVPPSHGEWLASHFGAKENVKIDVRAEDAGLGHFSYFPTLGPVYQTGEQTMPKTLLELCARA